ncbi:hypothetical protein PybrP1_004161 [[Pythium] brassicae (nom. inval.)]|nr:hypothetical protein PybrP1_004161 [[Pythium] brassicae (nom. inval.)]
MVLTAARLVCADKGLEQLVHVWEAMNDCLDHSRAWSLERAAARGHKFLVQHLALAVPQQSAAENALVMDFAARNGHLEILQWLHATERLSGCSTRSMDDAAKNGHLAIVQWLHEHRSEGCTTKAMDYAAKHGHLDVVQWLHAHRAEGCTAKAMDLSAQNGFLDVLVWLDAHRSEGCSAAAVSKAVAAGHLAVVRWLCEHRKMECTPAAMVNAARNGHVHVLEYLGVHFPALFESVGAKMVHAATAKGHLAVLNWLVAALPMKALKCEEANGSWMDVAAEYGQVRILRWFHEHATALPMGADGRLPRCTDDAVEKAAGNGHRAALEYLHAHELVRLADESSALRALVAAVHGGHRECVEWLVARCGALFEARGASTAAMDAAAGANRVDLLQLLLDGRATASWRASARAVDEAAGKGHLAVLVWLAANEGALARRSSSNGGEPVEPPASIWTPLALDLAATNGHLAVVQWLTAHHARECLTLDAFNAAAYMDHLEVVRFLYAHARASCSLAQALEHAEEGGAEDTLLWLQALGGGGV